MEMKPPNMSAVRRFRAAAMEKEGGFRAPGGPTRNSIPASRSRPGSEEAEQLSLPGRESGAESLGSEAGPEREAPSAGRGI